MGHMSQGWPWFGSGGQGGRVLWSPAPRQQRRRALWPAASLCSPAQEVWGGGAREAIQEHQGGLPSADEAGVSSQTSALSSVKSRPTSVCARCQGSPVGAHPGPGGGGAFRAA